MAATKTLVASMGALMAAAGVLAVAPTADRAPGEHHDVNLTAGILDPLYDLTDNSTVTSLLNSIQSSLGTPGYIATAQFYNLVPSGFLNSYSALDPATETFVNNYPLSVSGTWVTNLLDAFHLLGNTSLTEQLTSVAGLLPNGVNYLFDQLAVDALVLSNALGIPGAESVPNIVNTFNPLEVLDASNMFGLTFPEGLEGALTATFVDLLGIL